MAKKKVDDVVVVEQPEAAVKVAEDVLANILGLSEKQELLSSRFSQVVEMVTEVAGQRRQDPNRYNKHFDDRAQRHIMGTVARLGVALAEARLATEDLARQFLAYRKTPASAHLRSKSS